jgi:hypothetical protein
LSCGFWFGCRTTVKKIQDPLVLVEQGPELLQGQGEAAPREAGEFVVLDKLPYV